MTLPPGWHEHSQFTYQRTLFCTLDKQAALTYIDGMTTYRVENSGLLIARIVGSRFDRVVLIRQISERPMLEAMVRKLNRVEALAGWLTRDDEIGRASCRERVWG